MLTKQLESVKQRKLPSPAGKYKRKDNSLAEVPTEISELSNRKAQKQEDKNGSNFKYSGKIKQY